MNEILDYIRDYKVPNDKPWLILGKGPSFSRLPEVDIGKFNLISIGHVIRESPVEIAHIIDAYIIASMAEKIFVNAKVLLSPYYPHVDVGICPNHKTTLFKPDLKQPLQSVVDGNERLKQMVGQGRIFGYNLITAARAVGDSPRIYAGMFSPATIFDLLGRKGVKKIFSIGIDGGHDQSVAFGDLQNRNKIRGYDAQFPEMRRLANKHNIEFAPLFKL